MIGTVKFYEIRKCFGVIIGDDAEYLVLSEEIEADLYGRKYLVEGETVEFEPAGRKAVCVRPDRKFEEPPDNYTEDCTVVKFNGTTGYLQRKPSGILHFHKRDIVTEGSISIGTKVLCRIEPPDRATNCGRHQKFKYTKEHHEDV